jgi:hypothetical protein
VYEFNVPTFGKGVVFDVGHQERAEQFRFFSEALKTARLQTYVQLMVLEAEAFFKERLQESGEARGVPRARAVPRRTRTHNTHARSAATHAHADTPPHVAKPRTQRAG